VSSGGTDVAPSDWGALGWAIVIMIAMVAISLYPRMRQRGGSWAVLFQGALLLVALIIDVIVGWVWDWLAVMLIVVIYVIWVALNAYTDMPGLKVRS